MATSEETLRIFAVAAPGVEEPLAAELSRLGLPARAVPGGAEWEGDLDQVRRANLHSRLATRVLVRIGEFRARTFHELERHAARIAWDTYLRAGGAVQLRVSCRKSKLYHEGAVAERLMRAATAQVAGLVSGSAEPDEEGEIGGQVQLVVVRFLHDRCTISVDSSGDPLYRRGYRQALARAPLRETLAAAMLEASGWRPGAPLLDPMCGSGTIAIEAALIARNIAPGIATADREPRDFAFRSWPGHDAAAWERQVRAARDAVRGGVDTPIHASDRDPGAIEAASDNAARAGVLDDITLQRAPATSVHPPEGTGWLLTNPPYGVRVSRTGELRNLYAALGRYARDVLPGWRVGILSADPRLAAQLRLDLHEVLRTRNGGILVQLLLAEVPPRH